MAKKDACHNTDHSPNQPLMQWRGQMGTLRHPRAKQTLDLGKEGCEEIRGYCHWCGIFHPSGENPAVYLQPCLPMSRFFFDRCVILDPAGNRYWRSSMLP
jgi:hypothetical protein